MNVSSRLYADKLSEEDVAMWERLGYLLDIAGIMRTFAYQFLMCSPSKFANLSEALRPGFRKFVKELDAVLTDGLSKRIYPVTMQDAQQALEFLTAQLQQYRAEHQQ